MHLRVNPTSQVSHVYVLNASTRILPHLQHNEIDPRVPWLVPCSRAPGRKAGSRTAYPCTGRSCLAARTRRVCSNGCQAIFPGRARRRPRAAGTGSSERRRATRWPCSARGDSLSRGRAGVAQYARARAYVTTGRHADSLLSRQLSSTKAKVGTSSTRRT